jgi:hypothetical protein
MSGPAPALPDLAPRLAEIALDAVAREYPYATGHVVDGPDDRALPRELHPAFYGCFDWHSAVHMHWTLVHLLRRFPDRIEAGAVRARLDAHLTPAALEVETGYLRAHPHFERPYGWAWLYRLAAECDAAGAEAAGWSAALEPAVRAVDELCRAWLAGAGRPVREGTHANSAFALGLLLDSAGQLRATGTAELIRNRAADWFLADRDAPARWEPSAHDFLSPALTEADLVRRLLSGDEFTDWWARFLPALPESLTRPSGTHAPGDGQAGHLWGLDLHRAAAMASIAAALTDAGRATELREHAARHLAAALPALDDEDYQLRHWLPTFAVLALEARGPE